MKKLALFLFIVTAFVFLSSGNTYAAAGPVGSLYLDPVTGPYTPGVPFGVGLGVNVGSTNKVNVVKATFIVDSGTGIPEGAMVIEQCTPGSGYQALIGGNACVISGNKVTITVQSSSAEGPSGAVVFGNIIVHAGRTSTVKGVLAESEVIVKKSDGVSEVYPLTGSQDATLTIGGGSGGTTVPTVPQGNDDPYGFPIGTKDQLLINIGTGNGTISQGNGPKITFGVKLFGVQNTPDIKVRLSATDLITQITPVANQQQFGCETAGTGQYFFDNLAMTADGSGVYHPTPNGTYTYKGSSYQIDAQGWVTLIDVPNGIPVSFGVKGPKHRNMKTENNVILTTGTPTTQNYSWIATELEPGDLPNPQNGSKQDCTLNSVDLSLAISRIGSTATTDLAVADVNFDGVINGNDISKVVNTMSRKPDDDR